MSVDLVPAPATGTEGPRSLSPSRAADFKACPLLYRFRTVDRLPEAPSSVASRGTLVHSVLERLFDLPAPARTAQTARALLQPEWDALREADPEVQAMFADAGELAGWLGSAERLLETYFGLEDPTRLDPESRELLVEVALTDGLLLRGIVDRLDVNAAGDLRVVDYKTGSSPPDLFEARAMFQLKFYALVLWRLRGVVPRQLRLLYLGDGQRLSLSPDAEDLERFEGVLRALWAAIAEAHETRVFLPNPGRICQWCDHRALCPAYGGTPPPWPEPRPARDSAGVDPPELLDVEIVEAGP